MWEEEQRMEEWIAGYAEPLGEGYGVEYEVLDGKL